MAYAIRKQTSYFYNLLIIKSVIRNLEAVPPSGGSGEDLNSCSFQLPEVAHILQLIPKPLSIASSSISHLFSLTYKDLWDPIEFNPVESSFLRILTLIIAVQFILWRFWGLEYGHLCNPLFCWPQNPYYNISCPFWSVHFLSDMTHCHSFVILLSSLNMFKYTPCFFALH